MNQRPFDDRNPIPLARAEVQAAAELVRYCQGASTEQFEAKLTAARGGQARHRRVERLDRPPGRP